MDAYGKGFEKDPSNSQIQDGLQQVIMDKKQSEEKPFSYIPLDGIGIGIPGIGIPDGVLDGPRAEKKLKSNPKIAKYFDDPSFNKKWFFGQQDPQMMIYFIQTDIRFMDVLKELTDIDIMDIQEREVKNRDFELNSTNSQISLPNQISSL